LQTNVLLTGNVIVYVKPCLIGCWVESYADQYIYYQTFGVKALSFRLVMKHR